MNASSKPSDKSQAEFKKILAKLVWEDLNLPEEPERVTVIREVSESTLDFHPETGLMTRAEGYSLFSCSDGKTRRLPWRYDIANHKMVLLEKQIFTTVGEMPTQATIPVGDFHVPTIGWASPTLPDRFNK